MILELEAANAAIRAENDELRERLRAQQEGQLAGMRGAEEAAAARPRGAAAREEVRGRRRLQGDWGEDLRWRGRLRRAGHF